MEHLTVLGLHRVSGCAAIQLLDGKAWQKDGHDVTQVGFDAALLQDVYFVVERSSVDHGSDGGRNNERTYRSAHCCLPRQSFIHASFTCTGGSLDHATNRRSTFRHDPAAPLQ